MSNVIDFLWIMSFGMGVGIGLYIVYSLLHLPKYFIERENDKKIEQIKFLASFIDPNNKWVPPSQEK